MNKLLTICFLLVMCSDVFGQTLAPYFKPKLKGKPYYVQALEDTDGNFILFGYIDFINGQNVSALTKIDRKGKVLSAFKTITDDRVANLRTTSNGKFFISGNFTSVNGEPVKGFARLNGDGSLDESFEIETKVGDFVIQPDGKIVGLIDSYNGYNQIARFNEDGSLDNSFSKNTGFGIFGPFYLDQDPAGNIYLGDYIKIIKLKPTGEIASDFQFGGGVGPIGSGNIWTIKCLSSGKLIVGGSFTELNGVPAVSPLLLNPDGTKDVSFNVGTGTVGAIYRFHEKTNGNILLSGYFTKFNGQDANAVEIKPDGALQKIIVKNTTSTIDFITETSDNKVLIGGEFQSINFLERSHIALFNLDYSLNTDFKPDISYNNSNGIFGCLSANGDFLLGSSASDAYGIYGNGQATISSLINLNILGVPESSFRSQSFGTSACFAAAFLENDKLIASGYLDLGKSVVLLKPDLSLDNSFNPGTGTAYNGQFNPPYLFKVRNSVIYMSGNFNGYNGTTTRGLVAINPDGSLQKAYPNLPVDTSVGDFDFQSDGKILVFGTFPFPSGTVNGIIRINQDGSIDNAFPHKEVSGQVARLRVRSDDKFYVAGNILAFGGGITSDIALIDKDGSIDPSFDAGAGVTGGEYEDIRAMEILPSGDLAIGGYFHFYNGNSANGFAVISASGAYKAIPQVRFGKNSRVLDIDVNGSHIFLTGRLNSEIHEETFGVAKISLENIPVPIAPTNLTLSQPSPPGFKLSWNESATNELGFLVERSLLPDSEFLNIATLDANEREYIDNTISANVKYYYRIVAFNDGGYSAYSNTASDTWVVPPPAKPELLTVALKSQGVFELGWQDKSSDEIGFVIEKSEEEFSEYEMVDTVLANITSYTDNQIEPEKVLFYRVRAFNIGGASDYTNTASLKWIPLPAKPTNLTVRQEKLNELILSWTDHAENELGFIIERSMANSAFAKIDSVDINATQLIDKVEPNKPYSYRVVAYNHGGNSEPSNSISVESMYLPATPEQLKAKQTGIDQVTITWNNVSTNETGYLLERSKDGGVLFPQSFTINSGTTQFVDDVDLAENLTYRIKSFNKVGESSFSNLADVHLILGIELNEPRVIAFPNPIRDELFLSFSTEVRGHFTLTNSLGQVVANGELSMASIQRIATYSLVPGSYILLIEPVNSAQQFYRLTKI